MPRFKTQCQPSMTLGQKPFENIVVKGEKAGNHIQEILHHLSHIEFVSYSANAFSFIQTKILSLGTELT